MAKHTCCWVLFPASAGGGDPLLRREAKYCGMPVKYRIRKDDDGNLVRKYDSFCPRHQGMVDATKVGHAEEDELSDD